MCLCLFIISDLRSQRSPPSKSRQSKKIPAQIIYQLYEINKNSVYKIYLQIKEILKENCSWLKI